MEPDEIVRRDLPNFEATAAFARQLADSLRGGEFLALDGDLGAGKTSFTRELTRALGCSRLANSPTFALFQRYRGGTFPVLHGDLYRLTSERELEDLGWDEMLSDNADGITVLEWASRFPSLLPPDRLHLTWILGAEEEQRAVDVRALGPRSQRLWEALQ